MKKKRVRNFSSKRREHFSFSRNQEWSVMSFETFYRNNLLTQPTSKTGVMFIFYTTNNIINPDIARNIIRGRTGLFSDCGDISLIIQIGFMLMLTGTDLIKTFYGFSNKSCYPSKDYFSWYKYCLSFQIIPRPWSALLKPFWTCNGRWSLVCQKETSEKQNHFSGQERLWVFRPTWERDSSHLIFNFDGQR